MKEDVMVMMQWSKSVMDLVCMSHGLACGDKGREIIWTVVVVVVRVV